MGKLRPVLTQSPSTNPRCYVQMDQAWEHAQDLVCILSLIYQLMNWAADFLGEKTKVANNSIYRRNVLPSLQQVHMH